MAISKKLLQEALDLITEHGSGHAAQDATGIPDSTLRSRYRTAISRGMTPSPHIVSTKDKELTHLRSQVKHLTSQVARFERQDSIQHDIRTKILSLTSTPPAVPTWSIKKPKKQQAPGMPTLLCSDLHWGEVVRSEEIGGVPNAYNLRIANERLERLFTKTIDLLINHMVYPDYPGIHLFLGGDLFSGNLHDLAETNEAPMMKAFLDLYGALIAAIDLLVANFPKVHISGVVGNHGRTSFKPKTKDRTATNFDWLLYNMLEKHYEKNHDVTFNIPEGTDTRIQIYNHQYLLTHGDQFKGGDGIIGPIGPITRGDVKKRTRNMQIGQDYDTMVCGHFHTYLSTRRVIVNGSLVGMNEYAYIGNMGYEEPIQALWITNPDHGITFSIPIYVGGKECKKLS